MTKLIAIVEGQGDQQSVPVVLRRLLGDWGRHDVQVLAPLRGKRQKIVRQGELERAVVLAAAKVGGGGAVLVLLDSDEDLPCELGPALLKRAQEARSDMAVGVVIAQKEMEAWFVGSIESLRGFRGVPLDAEAPDDPEAVNAKAWLRAVMGRSYSPVADQPAFAARFDVELASARCRSFSKFAREVQRLVTPASEG